MYHLGPAFLCGSGYVLSTVTKNGHGLHPSSKGLPFMRGPWCIHWDYAIPFPERFHDTTGDQNSQNTLIPGNNLLGNDGLNDLRCRFRVHESGIALVGCHQRRVWMHDAYLYTLLSFLYDRLRSQI